MVEECTYDAHGTLSSAVFDCSEPFVRHYYHYKPGYPLPADEPGEAWYEPIDSRWYHEVRDWN
jgi:hypothetical protein